MSIDPALSRLLAKAENAFGQPGHTRAKTADISLRSEIAREALRRQLRISQFEALRRRVMPFAEARGYLTDEDVFRDVS